MFLKRESRLCCECSVLCGSDGGGCDGNRSANVRVDVRLSGVRRWIE